MHKNLINKLTVSSKILILFFLICTLLIAKSIFLIVFITVIILILMLLIDKSVKLYVEALKKSIFWLLFFGIIYIIVFREVIGVFIFIYKIALIVVLLTCFILSIDFGKLIDGIYTIILPLNKIIPNLNKRAYDIARFIYLCTFLTDDDNKIKKSQYAKNKICINVKYFLLPKLFYAVDKISKLEDILIINFYKVKKEKNDSLSLGLIILFFVLFIFAVYKEVIL